MEWVYFIFVICILLLLWVFLSSQNEPIRETGTFDLGKINSLKWNNKATQGWNGLYSQGWTVPHKIII